MTQSPPNLHASLRIIVIDNDPKIRESHRRLLNLWGCQTLVAEGEGDELLSNAKTLAFAERCHLALVDLRLRDDKDHRDVSGLELIRELSPTVCITVSGRTDWEAPQQAMNEYGAADYVAKGAAPDRVYQAITKTISKQNLCSYHNRFTWVGDVRTGADICALLNLERSDEVDELLGRLFPPPVHATVELLNNRKHASDRFSTLRRNSCVLKVLPECQVASQVVKIALKQKIAREQENYNTYVHGQLGAIHYPRLEQRQSLWSLGGLSYTFFGNNTIHTPKIFSSYYTNFKLKEFERIIQPLTFFFHHDMWGRWFRETQPLAQGQSLYDAYRNIWDKIDIIDNAERQCQWANEAATYQIRGLSDALPNPTYWLTQHYQKARAVQQPRLAVTHGDLHGENLFVEATAAWPIDFERTGYGPRLRDFAELIQDIITRLSGLSDREVYLLAVALCKPKDPGSPMFLPMALNQSAEAAKAFHVVQQLLLLAHEHTQYTDRRELLWSLMLDSLFVSIILPAENERKRLSRMFASVICARLERWERNTWPPEGWLKPE